MTEQNEMIVAQPQQTTAVSNIEQEERLFALTQRKANMYVNSELVPQQYKGNIGNCCIAVDMAQRMNANPLMVMQNLYIVHGNPGWSSKFLIACINQCGRFTPLRYQQEGEGTAQWKCRATATDKTTGELLVGPWASMEMAKKEGWSTKSGSKWQTMPELMLMYRAAAFFQRTFAPEISMGFLTKEENEDIIDVPYTEIKPKAKMTAKERLELAKASMTPANNETAENTPQNDNDEDFGSPLTDEELAQLKFD